MIQTFNGIETTGRQKPKWLKSTCSFTASDYMIQCLQEDLRRRALGKKDRFWLFRPGHVSLANDGLLRIRRHGVKSAHFEGPRGRWQNPSLRFSTRSTVAPESIGSNDGIGEKAFPR